MRNVALLLGGLLTAGSAYVAQVAVSSARLDRTWELLNGTVAPRPDAIWYGGVLAPIVVEVSQARAATFALKDVGRVRDGMCVAATQVKSRATSPENVRTSIGLVM